MGKYYLYRHVRVDSNSVFYIGIGSKRSENNYSRAYSKNNRNVWWVNITNITDYIVDILFESNDRSEIERKEIEFISLYGRKDLGNGTLCNLTDGGEGAMNTIISKDTRLKHSIRSKGNKYRMGTKQSVETRALMSLNRTGEKHPMYNKKHKPETIQKFRIAQLGSIKSENTKKKHKERSLLPNQCNRKPCGLIDTLSNEYWEAISIIELSKICPISRDTLKKLKVGKSVSIKNKKYKFINL